MEKIVLGLDQSTSGSKVLAVNEAGKIVFKSSREHKQYYPKPGYVEHDPEEIVKQCLELIQAAKNFAKDRYEVLCLSITNQRETILFWDRDTGKPLCNAMVWQCRRGLDICETLKSQGYEETVKEKTGLKLDPYFSGSKILWAMENIPAVKAAYDKGNLAVGTMDSYLVFRFTGGRVFATDHTNASRTLLYNIHDTQWDASMLKLFGIDERVLPEIRHSNGTYGSCDPDIVHWDMPIAGVIGDSQGALFGQKCFQLGRGKATFGTGSSILMYTGDVKVASDKGIMTSLAWNFDGKTAYAIEGMINSSGDTLKWVKDNLGLYETIEEVDQMIESLDSNEGVYIVPAFSGLGAPYWEADARASIVGMSRKTGKAHIVRAAVESMAYQVADLVSLMEEELDEKLEVLYADGGPTANSFLMQLQAELLGTVVEVGDNNELSAMGAVFLGGLALGLWKDFKELESLEVQKFQYRPKEDGKGYAEQMEAWHRAVRATIAY